MNLEGLARARLDLGFMDRARNALRQPDLRPAWKELRKPARADLREHAKKQEGPGGSWAPASSRTRARAMKGRKRARRLLGRLPGAVTSKLEKRRMLWRSLVKWSQAHNDPRGARVGHGAKLPGRTFLYFSDELLERGAAIIAKGIAFLIEVG